MLGVLIKIKRQSLFSSFESFEMMSGESGQKVVNPFECNHDPQSNFNLALLWVFIWWPMQKVCHLGLSAKSSFHPLLHLVFV